MLVEPIMDSGGSRAPTIQARLPGGGSPAQNHQEGKDAEKALKKAGLQNIELLAADLEKNLKIIHDVDLKFSVHKASGRIMVVVRDEQSGEVIREIPESEILDLVARLDEMIGLIFDKRG